MDGLQDATAEEQLEYKREYAIRQREMEMKRKQEEEMEKKKQALDEKKRKEEREKAERSEETKQQYSKTQMKKRALQMENEYRDRCREAAITKKRNNWLTKENSQIQGMLEDYYIEEEELQERRLEAKERKNLVAREELEKKIFFLNAQKARERQREVNETERADARKERAIHRIDELKLVLDEELDAYIEHPTHIPLKQAFCNQTRPVPSTTLLLAATKDQEEDLADLKATNLEERAKALKKSLFIYVQELKEGHERMRLKPPEPEIDEKRSKAKAMMSPNTTKGSSTGFGAKATRGKENKNI
jgi:hypothetical protein